MKRKAIGLIGAILGLVVNGGAVANADDCGGPGPDVGYCANYYDNNDSGGASDSGYDTWPPGADWGSDSGGDGTPIVLPAP